MRDLKYIIKRVIIGVGIVLVLAYIRTGKALALDTSNLSVVSSYRIIPNGRVYDIAYDRELDRMYIYPQNDSSNYMTIPNVSQYPYFYCWNQKSVSGSNFASAINGVSDSNLVSCVFSDKKLKYYYNSNLAKRFMVNNDSFDYIVSATYQENAYIQGFAIMTSEFESNYNFYRTGFSSTPNSFGETYNYKRNGTIISNYDIYNYSTNELYYGANLSFIPGVPEFVSWNSNKILSNNIITGYSFEPEFSNFDTDNYVYQYKFGKDSTTWLSLVENNQFLKFNANGTIYVRIKNLSNNEIVDSATFTISNLGQFNSNVNYDINFTGEYRTHNYLNNTISSKSSSLIEEYQIYIDYIPKTSTLKYQYQFVVENGSLDSNSWENVPSSDNGSATYVATSNGTLYARILDSNDVVKDTATFTVNSIGTLALDSGNDETTKNFYSKIGDKIGFGGPIGSLINIPISLVSSLVGAFTGNFNTCTDYNLGSLWNSNLVLPCVNIKQKIGNSLYTTIDLICSCCMFYMLIKMLLLAYDKFINMERDPLGDSTILYGDRRF